MSGPPTVAETSVVSAETFCDTSVAAVVTASTLAIWALPALIVAAASSTTGRAWAVTSRTESVAASSTLPTLSRGTARKATSTRNATAATIPAMSPMFICRLLERTGGVRCGKATRKCPRPGTGVAGARGARDELARSARVVLDDELDVAGHGDLGALRAAGELGAQLLQLDVEVARDVRQDVA